MSTWTIGINSRYEKKLDRYNFLLNKFILFSENVKVTFSLNMESSSYSFVEKFISDNIKFHMKRLNIKSDSKKCVSFWTKRTEYDFDHIHMHIDHCDYESRVHNTEIRKPIFTSIIYLEENSCPTLITEVTRDMVKSGDFLKNNNKMCFSFPKTLKNIVFESGKYFHGESYLTDYEKSSRKTIVIALWDEDNTPLFLPHFDRHFFYYYLFVEYQINIDKNEFDEFSTDDILCTLENRDDQIITIPVTDIGLLNGDFFHKLIVDREKKILYRFAKLINTIKNPDTVILDFSNLPLSRKLFPGMNCQIERFKMTFKADTKHEHYLFKEILKLKEEVILSSKKENMDMIEQYVYDICTSHLISIDDFQITFGIANNNTYTFSQNEDAYQTCVVCLEDSETPLLFSDIDSDSFKYKELEKRTICLIPTRKDEHIFFSGSYYHKYFSNKLLIIKFWRKNVPIKFNQYTCLNGVVERSNVNSRLYLKKKDNFAITAFLDEDIFHELVYNSNPNFNNIDIKLNNDLLVLSISKQKPVIVEKSPATTKRLRKIKFSELEI